MLLWLLLGVALGQDVDRGRVLAGLGNCAGCHTADDGEPYAGGHAIETTFGTFYGTNLTPDPEHGIGQWTREDFVRAMRRGRTPKGASYYPAFPFAAFTGLTDRDLDDLWAYLGTLEPSSRPDSPHELRGIAKGRWVMGFWRASNFRRGPFEPDPDQDEVLNRGAYLVEVVGHCGECHSPRGKYGGVRARRALSGSTSPPHPSPNITPHADGIGDWTPDDLLVFLEMGMDPDGDFVGRGMYEVIDAGTSQLSPADREAMVRYLLAVPSVASR